MPTTPPPTCTRQDCTTPAAGTFTSTTGTVAHLCAEHAHNVRQNIVTLTSCRWAETMTYDGTLEELAAELARLIAELDELDRLEDADEYDADALELRPFLAQLEELAEMERRP